MIELILLELIFIASAAENITKIIREEKIFNWFREISLKIPILGNLISCGVCLSFWSVIFLFIMINITSLTWVGIYLLICHRLAGIFHLLFDMLFKKKVDQGLK